MWFWLFWACRDGKISSQNDIQLDGDGDGITIADGDCDDSNAAVFPLAEEECDGIDNDCDGIIDPPELAGTAYFLDEDGDGYGDETQYACELPIGYSLDGGDCDDSDATIYPQAIEQCGDDIDQNCDGLLDNAACFYTVNDAEVQFFSDPLYPLGVGGAFIDINADGMSDMVAHAPAEMSILGLEKSISIFHAPFSAEQTSLDVVHRIALSTTDVGGASVLSSDMNGDGQDDLVIASEKNNYAGQNAGAVYLIWGPIEESLSLDTDYDSRWTGVEGGLAGYSVADLGDVTGDGRSDIVIGAYEYDVSVPNGGAAYIVFGQEEGEDISLDAADVVLLGGSDDNLGYEVSSAGDLNGDGTLDVAINAYRFDTTKRNAGRTFVFFGPIDASLTLEQADIRIDGYEEIGQLGATIAPLSDIDGDGNDDLLVASQFADVDDQSLVEDEGAAFLLVGLEAGDISLEDARAKIFGEHETENFGREAVGLGDVDDDGFGDILISSKRYGVEALEQGRGSIFLGPLEGTFTSGQGHALLYGAHEYAWTGITMDVEVSGEDTQLLLGSRQLIGDDILGVTFLLSLDFF